MTKKAETDGPLPSSPKGEVPHLFMGTIHPQPRPNHVQTTNQRTPQPTLAQ